MSKGTQGILPTGNEWRRGIRYAIVVLTLAFLVWNAQAVVTGLVPFVIAYLISIALDPVVSYLARAWKLGRGWSALVVILLFLGVGGLLLTWATTALIAAIAHFLEVFPEYRETMVNFVQDLSARLASAYANLPPDVIQFLNENTSRLGQGVEQALSAAGRLALGVLGTVPSLLSAALLVPLATFFFCKDLPAIKRFLWSVVPSGDQNRIRTVIADLWGAAWKYLRAQAILVSISAVVITLGLWIIGVERWFAAGVLIGVLDLLPVLGPTAAFVPWIVYLAIVGNTAMAVSLVILYGIAVGTRALVEAKVIGDSVGLHPLAILLSMYLGALLWGVKGAILGPLLTLVGKAVYKAWQRVEAPGTQA